MKKFSKMIVIIVAVAISLSYTTNAQVSINTDGSDPDASAGLDVKFSDKGFLPPRLTQNQIYYISNPAEGLVVYNSDAKELNLYNGTQWVNMSGENVFPQIGDFFGGGVVFYLDGNVGGLICALSDQSSGMQWYNGSFTTTGATGTAIGTGQANTTAIINNQGAGSYAAQICDDYDDGTYNDWYMPSKDELDEMYDKQTIINATAIANGGSAFSVYWYWCSTEYDVNTAIIQHFTMYDIFAEDKSVDAHCVRAIRAF